MFLVLLFAFLFGLSVGSFLNVVILRYHKASSFQRDAFRLLGGRSHCPHCGKVLGFWELIPVFSFLIQQGRCRSCFKPISWQYSLVELTTGIVFALIAWQFFLAEPPSFSIFLYFIFAGLLIILFVYDARWGLIPDFASYGIFGLAFIRVLFFSFFQIPDSRFQILNPAADDFLLAFFVFSLFFGLWFFSKGRAMGFGDVKLAPAIALFLGWPLGLLAILFSFWFGAIYGILALYWRKGVTMKSEIPFGPFLVLGAFIALFLGNEVLHWYVQLLL